MRYRYRYHPLTYCLLSQDPACPLQTLSFPASAPPTSWYMKHYAANQEDWIGDFAAAFNKMMSNGSCVFVKARYIS